MEDSCALKAPAVLGSDKDDREKCSAWDKTPGVPFQQCIAVSTARLNSCDVLPGTDAILVCGDDSQLSLWDCEGRLLWRHVVRASETRARKSTTELKLSTFTSCRTLGETGFLTCTDNCLQRWSLEQVRQRSEHQQGQLTAAGGKPDTHVHPCLQAPRGGWEAACMSQVEAHDSQITSVCVYKGGSRAVTTSKDGTARVWDTKSMALARTFENHGCEVCRTTVQGRGAATRLIARWPCSLVGSCWGHTESTQSPDSDGLLLTTLSAHHHASQRVLTESLQAYVSTLHVERVVRGSPLLPHPLCNSFLAFSRATPACPPAQTPAIKVYGAAALEDGRMVVSTGQLEPEHASVMLWCPETGEVLHTLGEHSGWLDACDITSTSWGSGGEVLVAAAGVQGVVHVWDAGGRLRYRAALRIGACSSVKFSACGGFILVRAYAVATSMTGTSLWRVWSYTLCGLLLSSEC